MDVVGLPWLFKGVRDVKTCQTAADVISAANLDFRVAKCELFANMPSTNDEINLQLYNNGIFETESSLLYNGRSYSKLDNSYATYRTDNNKPLGLVKSKYEIVQNIDAFKFFDDAIGPDKAIWDTAGCFDGGRKIFVSAKLPDTIVVNGKDHIENYLVFTNSHDGSSGVNIMFTPVRIVCQNCLPGARKSADQFIRFRHTESVHGKINTAADILGIARQQEIIMQNEFNKLAATKMNDFQVMDYIASIHLNSEEYSKLKREDNGLLMFFHGNNQVIRNADISTRKYNMCVNTMDYYHFGPGQREIQGTAWGAFNAITGYYSNVANLKDEKRMDSILYGNAGNVMNKALNTIAA